MNRRETTQRRSQNSNRRMVFTSFQLSNVMGVINRNVAERYWARRLRVGGASPFYGGYQTYSGDPIAKRTGE